MERYRAKYDDLPICSRRRRMLKDLCAYPREDRLKAITELEKDAGWPAYPLHVRVQMLHSYLNKKRAHPPSDAQQPESPPLTGTVTRR